MNKQRQKYAEEFKKNAAKLSYTSLKSVAEIAEDPVAKWAEALEIDRLGYYDWLRGRKTREVWETNHSAGYRHTDNRWKPTLCDSGKGRWHCDIGQFYFGQSRYIRRRAKSNTVRIAKRFAHAAYGCEQYSLKVEFAFSESGYELD